MVGCGIFSVFVFVVVNIALTCGQSTLVCHYCNSDVHGAGCHDPLTPGIGRQSCANFQITVPAKHTQRDDEDPERVCFTMSYVDRGALVTLRGCEFELYDDQHVCTFYEEDMANNPVLNYTQFSCNTCKTDFCNSSSSVYAYVTTLILGIVVLMFC